MSKIILGKEYKDKVTGFKGVAMSRIEYLTGCTQYCLQPQGITKEGKFKESYYIDEDRLVECGKGVYVEPVVNGGPEFGGVPARKYPDRH